MLSPDTFRRRRQALLDRIEGGVAVVPAMPTARRNGDVDHAYRPDSDFHYLTGFAEPQAVAVLTRVHKEHKFVLFVRPRDKEREIWNGRRAGVEGAVKDFGADAAFPIEKLQEELPKYLEGATTLHYRLGDQPDFDRALIQMLAALRAKTRVPTPWPHTVTDLGLLLHEMRLFKSPEEMALLRRAAAITRDAHLEAMKAARPGMHEYEIQALLELHYRRAGGQPGYYPIVAGGANATILHYHENDRALAAGELLLIDSGAELGFYTADVTRTFPLRARFSATQRAIYELVLEAHRQAVEQIRPGATVDGIHQLTLRVLTSGLVDLGLLEGPVDKALETEAYKKFYMHRTSHWLGMDVHDAGRYYQGGQSRALEPGMVLTVEPGIYVAQDEPSVAERWRGIGVRIEDDVEVTGGGHVVITDDVPRSVDAIEAVCAA